MFVFQCSKTLSYLTLVIPLQVDRSKFNVQTANDLAGKGLDVVEGVSDRFRLHQSQAGGGRLNLVLRHVVEVLAVEAPRVVQLGDDLVLRVVAHQTHERVVVVGHVALDRGTEHVPCGPVEPGHGKHVHQHLVLLEFGRPHHTVSAQVSPPRLQSVTKSASEVDI